MITTKYFMLILLLLFGLLFEARAQAEIHVDRSGSAAPDGSVNKPYQLVEAGACKARPGGTVVIHPSTYNETFTVNYPVKLTATGPAVLGQRNGKPHTKLKIVTYNTHLFGGEGAGRLPTFADGTRAAYIAESLKQENADIVGLQEVWDEDLANALIQRAGYPYHYYNNDKDEATDFLNSGLLLLSKYPLVNPSLTFYEDEVNFLDCLFGDCSRYLDSFASKGFLQATVIKDGFQLGIFSTHTQAEFHEDAVKARRKQLEQLGAQIQKYRAENPGAEVITMGDFNVVGESGEYAESLLPLLRLHDAYPNLAPCQNTTMNRVTCDFNDNALARIFGNTENDCNKQRLDYVLYSHGNAFDVLPVKVEVRRYQVSPAISEDDKSSKDLSDHYGLAAEISLWRRN